MGQGTFSIDEERLLKAVAYMDCALQLVDQADAPADIGAHLDLAICRLKDIMPEPAIYTETARTSASQGRKIS